MQLTLHHSETAAAAAARQQTVLTCHWRKRESQRCHACRGPSNRRLSCNAVAGGAEPPPFKLLSVPVYSLSTNAAGLSGQPTMNITTYASPVALSPSVYAVGLYKGTQSWENFTASGTGLLQILRRQHAEHVELLGKTSARDVDKLAELTKRGCCLSDRLGFACLEDCAGVMELQQISDLLDAGDHAVALCRVRKWENVAAEGEPLYTGYLRERGYI